MTNFYRMPLELRRIVMDLSMSCLIEKPTDYADHCLKYFEKLRSKKTSGVRLSDDPVSNSLVNLGMLAKRRISISTDPYDPEGHQDSDVSVMALKSNEVLEKLTKVVKNVFILSGLAEEELLKVMHAMNPRSVVKGEYIIEEGSLEANYFYIVDEGVFEATVKSKTGGVTVVRTYNNSGSFGELALLYDMPRAATVQALTDGKLWELSRNNFRKIVLKAAHTKRERFKELIRKVEFLNKIGDYQKLDLADSLFEVDVKKGEIIFNQGDKADGMYFIESGSVEFIGDYTGKGKVSISVLRTNDYFGELALITHNRRSLTAQALENTKLAFLDKATFERLLGPCQEVLRNNFKNYESSMIKAVGTASPVYYYSDSDFSN